MTGMSQGQLFEYLSGLPEGFIYQEEFITAVEEARLLAEISQLSLQEASYRQWRAKRRIVSFGGRYDFSHRRLNPAEPLPDFLLPLRDQIARWTGIPRAALQHGAIAEYRPGTQLRWHRDVPDFDTVIGVSLAGVARMRFRRYPPDERPGRAQAVLDLEPRSTYVIEGASRWGWQHAISPVKHLRYSITFRTLSGR